MKYTPHVCAALLGAAFYACANPVDLPADLVVGPLEQGGSGTMAGAGGELPMAGSGGGSAGVGGDTSAGGSSAGAAVGGSGGGASGGSAGVGGTQGTAGVAAAGTGGGVGGGGGDAGAAGGAGAGGDNTAGTQAQAGAGGEPQTGAVFNPPDTCDFDDTTGCEDLDCSAVCEESSCETRCSELIECVTVTNVGCSTPNDPLCGADPLDMDLCSPEYQAVGNGNSPMDSAFVASSNLIECLCTVPRPE